MAEVLCRCDYVKGKIILDYLGECNHKGPYKREAGGSQFEKM